MVLTLRATEGSFPIIAKTNSGVYLHLIKIKRIGMKVLAVEFLRLVEKSIYARHLASAVGNSLNTLLKGELQAPVTAILALLRCKILRNSAVYRQLPAKEISILDIHVKTCLLVCKLAKVNVLEKSLS